jgi:hypothetical protein
MNVQYVIYPLLCGIIKLSDYFTQSKGDIQIRMVIGSHRWEEGVNLAGVEPALDGSTSGYSI